MKFHPGDKVSFINEKLVGVIQQIIPGNICGVEIEDGFTLDITESELVLQQSFLRKQTPVAASETKELPVAVADPSEVFKEVKGFQLLILPHAQQVLNGPL